MSNSSGSLLDALFAGLSTEQLIAEEQEHQEPELVTTSTLGKRTSMSPDPDSDDNNEEDSPGPEGASSLGRSNSVAQPNAGTLRMDQAIRRIAKRLKLSNESTSLVEQFAQVSLKDPPLASNI